MTAALLPLAALAPSAAAARESTLAFVFAEGPDWWPVLALVLLALLLRARPELLSRLPRPEAQDAAALERRVAALEAELARLRAGAGAEAPPAPEAPAPPATAPAGPPQGDLYDRAVAVVSSERLSTPAQLTRRLSIGWEEAASLLSRMEAEGVVSARDEAGARRILRPAPGAPTHDAPNHDAGARA